MCWHLKLNLDATVVTTKWHLMGCCVLIEVTCKTFFLHIVNIWECIHSNWRLWWNWCFTNKGLAFFSPFSLNFLIHTHVHTKWPLFYLFIYFKYLYTLWFFFAIEKYHTEVVSQHSFQTLPLDGAISLVSRPSLHLLSHFQATRTLNFTKTVTVDMVGSHFGVRVFVTSLT